MNTKNTLANLLSKLQQIIVKIKLSQRFRIKLNPSFRIRRFLRIIQLMQTEITAKFISAVIGILVVTTFIVSCIQLYTLYLDQLDQNQVTLNNQAAQISSEIDTWFSSIKNQGLAMSSLELFQKGSEMQILQALESYYNSTHGQFESLAVVNNQGIQTIGYPFSLDAKKLDFSDTDYFKKTLASKEPQVSSVIKSKKTGWPVIVICSPFLKANGDVNGMLVQVINLEYIQSIAARTKIGHSGISSISLPDGRYIAHKNFENVLEANRLPADVLQLAAPAGPTSFVADLNGEKGLGSIAKVPGTNWNVAVSVPVHELMSGFYSSMLIGIVALFIILVISGISAYKIFSSMLKPLIGMTGAIQLLGQGDLSATISHRSSDELGRIAGAINSTICHLQEIAVTVHTHSHKISSASQEIAAASQQASQSIEQIAQTANELATGAHETGQMIQHSAEQTRQVSNLSQTAQENINELMTSTHHINDSARLGQQSISNAVATISQIKETTKQNTIFAQQLDEQSKQIHNIVGLIDNIAGQTNLLALNAAIEAARAGEHGRGFAVVADEVRKLAEQCRKATQQINNIINIMLGNIANVVNSFQTTNSAMTEGVTIINIASNNFSDITMQIDQIMPKIDCVTNLAAQQAQAAVALQDAIQNIAAITQQSAASTETAAANTQQINSAIQEIAANAQTMTNMSAELEQAVNWFKI